MCNHRIILRNSDIEQLEGIGRSRSSELYTTIKDSLGKTNGQKVTIAEYCEYRGFDYEETLITLELKKPQHV